MACAGRCSIYEGRPKFCRDYPKLSDILLPGCTYHFVGDGRRGSCQPEVCEENICCSYPRDGGEPEGRSMDEFAGGSPCKHLVWVEVEEEKLAEDDGAPSISGELYDLVLSDILGGADAV